MIIQTINLHKCYSFFIFVSCICVNLLQAATTETTENIWQTDNLRFIPPAHVESINITFHKMVREIHVALEKDIFKEKPKLTLLSASSILGFEEGDTCFELTAKRGRSGIYMSTASKTQEIITNPQVFCAGDRKHYQTKMFDSIKKAMEGLIASTNAAIPLDTFLMGDGKDVLDAEWGKLRAEFDPLIRIIRARSEGVKTEMTSHPLAALAPVVKGDIDKYVSAHIDDGEGAAVDSLVLQIEENPSIKAKLASARYVYPLVYTENDPCRCCLISIRNYLTDQISHINQQATIIPIVLSNGIYHEKGESIQIALRYHYPWVPDSFALSTALASDTSEEVDPDDSMTDVPARKPILFLYHMSAKAIYEATNGNFLAALAASEIPSAAAAAGAGAAAP